ncbi:C-X-C chemokine receptor type 2-like [Carcharodon carcharias]|uniref:C-X-C chemokine receptor type 2-like n=1 Tax=Carcharodon carcharias TaxID=13397 RepID=UPI001B7ED846|nr:C-X-C chemokine receptor type 2-like [Carcharodon carcharias]XP_041057004.1 C-X-C chemokine receptor type 2-like [Carcharodon carcharias]XP_041057005.1 C-X-C chemokine receptor type 2-like [Carcharodon carcharias]XP_041057006.1 C-X-C chemokine receptor type 2-like [Carcharodon carcharias]
MDDETSITFDPSDFYEMFEDYSNDSYPLYDSDMTPCNLLISGNWINMAIAVVYSLVCFLAVIGNIVVMVVILYNRRTISSTDIYLLLLAVADLLFAVTLPFWAVDAISGWVFGDAMCKIISMLQEVNFYSGILLLTCISINRYLSIVYSTQAHKQNKPFTIKVVCITVWVLATALSLPTLYKGEYTPPKSKRTMCYETLDAESAETWRVTTRFLRHIIGFLIPLAIMIFCYTMVIQKLCQTKGFQKQKAMKVIIAVVLAFLICLLPRNITVFIDTLMRASLIAETCNMRNHIDRALFGTQILGFLHCCINPILYAFIGLKFRKNLLKLLATKGIIKQGGWPSFKRSVSSSSESGLISSTI